MAYGIMAEFRAHPEHAEDFAAFLERHAEASRAEPGCLTFDVSRDAEDPALFLLYEVYTDEAAYQAHRATPHWQRFFEMAEPMVEPQGGTLFFSRRVMQRIAPAD